MGFLPDQNLCGLQIRFVLKEAKTAFFREILTSSGRTRTGDPGLMNPLLCQLSYAAEIDLNWRF
jgi:hypothetical protein